MEKHRSSKDIAAFVKTEFDKQHLEPQAEGAYHCIVGKHFASAPPGVGGTRPARPPGALLTSGGRAGAVSHETQQYILLTVDTLNVVLFRSRDVANAVLEP